MLENLTKMTLAGIVFYRQFVVRFWVWKMLASTQHLHKYTTLDKDLNRYRTYNRSAVLIVLLYLSWDLNLLSQTCEDAGCLPHATHQVPYQMAGQDHEQRSAAACQNTRYWGDANEGTERERGVGHEQRIFYLEWSSGARSKGGQSKRYKDTLKQTLKLTGINTETLHELAENRTAWRQALEKRVRSFEVERLKTRADKLPKRKDRSPTNSC